MKLEEAVSSLLGYILEEFSYHPLIAPYIDVSKDNPPQHYLHQYEIIARLVFRRPIRVLIGDEIGLGKTITSLTVARFLEKIGRASRILILVPRVLVLQWRRELIRMGVPVSKVRHLESDTISFWKRQGFPEGYYIASMDLLKREEWISETTDAPWDLVIIDEAHKLGLKTRRFMKLGKELVEAKPGRDVIFLSATPHRGDPRDYISRLQLLDPYLTEGWRSLDRRSFYELTHSSLLFRRTKEDINNIYEGREIFPPAKFYACVIKPRLDEAEFIARLVRFLRSKLVEFAYERGILNEKVIPLLTVLIFKRASSSPYAAMTTLQRLLIRRAAPELTRELISRVESYLGLGFEDYEYPDRDPEDVFNDFLDATSQLLTDRDREELENLRSMAESIMKAGDSKLNALISLLEDIMTNEGSKVVVFTEYKDTLEYIIENLRLKHREWAECILRLSSDETKNVDLFEKIRKRFEDPKSKARILIATDVVSEGVNLQVAHILINYEIPWSLMKVEQRIGRVWRLGQRKPVEAYTFFMGNIADNAALNAMYRKLVNLKRAELSPRPITGQELLLYADAEDIMRIPPSTAVKIEKGKRKFYRVTEARSIITYLREGDRGLERLVESIIAAKKEIERELASKGVLYKSKTRSEVERTVGLLGFANPAELLASIVNLIESSSTILGFEVSPAEYGIKISRRGEMPTTLSNLTSIYSYLLYRLTGRLTTQVSLVAYGREGRVALLPVQVVDGRERKILHRELIGIDLEDGSIMRGARLLEVVSKALSHCIGVEQLGEIEDIPITLLSKAIDEFKKTASRLLDPVSVYISRLSEQMLRNREDTWIRVKDLRIELSNPVGFIRFVTKPRTPVAIPEDVKKKAAAEAISIVMDIERMEGRIPETVPEWEHYDIRSVDPVTREVRFIEVKGHMGSEIYGELTDEEANLARREREKYWLYIVYDIESGKPKWVRFRDPMNTMNWRLSERIERRYILTPPGLGEKV